MSLEGGVVEIELGWAIVAVVLAFVIGAIATGFGRSAGADLWTWIKSRGRKAAVARREARATKVKGRDARRLQQQQDDFYTVRIGTIVGWVANDEHYTVWRGGRIIDVGRDGAVAVTWPDAPSFVYGDGEGNYDPYDPASQTSSINVIENDARAGKGERGAMRRPGWWIIEQPS